MIIESLHFIYFSLEDSVLEIYVSIHPKLQSPVFPLKKNDVKYCNVDIPVVDKTAV